MPANRSTRHSPIKRGPRAPYSLTCSNCRLRKVKCDGAQPQCRICLAYGETCRYDKQPPMSQILAMAQRITDLENALAESSNNPSSHEGSLTGDAHRASNQSPTSYPRPTESSWTTPSDRHTHTPGETYYQSTSAVEAPRETGEEQAPLVSQHVPSMDASQMAFWEIAATQLSAVHLQLPLEVVTHLLTTNWTWFHPTFMFVPRPLFLRDAAVGGRYFSPLLLATLCLHSTRLTNHALSENLLAQVRFLLGPELHRECSVTTIQALLLLSAREVGRGAMSQTWLYSGMAFRMAVDIGIFSRHNAANDDAEMRAVKDHLAWACYGWDKAISLYLGRAPALPETPNFDPPAIDDLLELETWSPYYGNTNSVKMPPEFTSHASSCFINFCRLAPIITDILMTVYAKKIPIDALLFVHQTRERLEQWRVNSPDHLKVEPSAAQSPPPHILCQNLLYYATIILLHRPFRGSHNGRSICRNASQSVEHLVLLVENTFGLSHVSYLMAYTIYTAATVAVLDLHDGVEGSQRRIETYLRALRSVSASCPGIQRSIDLIKKGVEGKMPPASSHTFPAANCTAPLDPGPLPAFPLDQCAEYAPFNVCSMDMLPFGGLDPYALDWAGLSGDSFGEIILNT